MTRDITKDCGKTRPTVLFVATTPFVVNPFLTTHLITLSADYRLVLCVNLDAYELTPRLNGVVELHHIPFARKIDPVTDIRTLAQLFLLIRKIRPDVIHSITPKGGLLAMTAGFLGRVPRRWHTFTGQVWATRSGLRRWFLKSFDRIVATLATRTFADSASQCRLLQDEGVVKRGGISMMGSGSIAGVDLARFHPDSDNRTSTRQRLGTTQNTCVFLFVGRLARDKGLFDLIHAFKQLARQEPSVELWVVGPDEDGLQESLQNAGADACAPIRWLGSSPSPEQFMSAADVLVLPSYREGFGTVVIEAAACAIPSIAYRIDGIIDAVADGQSGLLVEAGNSEQFCQAMHKLATDISLRQQLGQQAQQRAETSFSSISVTKAWLDFYHANIT